MTSKLPHQNKDGLTEEAFGTLLAWLDSDRNRAAEKYEFIRLKLIMLFECRRCRSPEEYTDKTFDRVARRLSEGETVRTTDKYLYFHGVALNLVKEYMKAVQRMRDEPLPEVGVPPENPEDSEDKIERWRKCLERLSTPEREMLIQYYEENALDRRLKRRKLAKRIGLKEGTLRIKIHRIREELKRCARTGQQ